MLRLRPEIVRQAPRRLVLDHGLHTLPAIHLAAATEEAPGFGSESPATPGWPPRPQSSRAAL